MDRVDELNMRISSRNDASSTPGMTFSPRPVNTKYMLFPMVDAVQPTSIPIKTRQSVNFLPASSAPFRDFNIEVESNLRNIRYALQADDRAIYVPSSSSDLYVNKVPKTKIIQTHPLLFVHAVSSVQHNKVKEQIFNNVRLR